MEAGSIPDVYAAARAATAAASTLTAVWRPPLARALRHAAQMFRALEYLHGRAPSVVHRDVKPANLLVTADLETVKLGDFGVTSSAAAEILLPAHLHAAVNIEHTRTRKHLNVLSPPTRTRFARTPNAGTQAHARAQPPGQARSHLPLACTRLHEHVRSRTDRAHPPAR